MDFGFDLGEGGPLFERTVEQPRTPLPRTPQQHLDEQDSDLGDDLHGSRHDTDKS